MGKTVYQAEATLPLIGESGDLAEVIREVRQVAPTKATVLVLGETGTGKDVLARLIHQRSRRADGPFVRVNCAVFPRDLLASELFGHERGAFTGAVERRLGRLDVARGGTLFLDEIGELPPDMQVKLLQVLQDKTYERVGGNETLQADVRLICATHRDLGAEVEHGTFREDLFYRLHVAKIILPALRQRRNDIPALADHYLMSFNALMNKDVSLSLEAAAFLAEYAWPGNVRELRNLMERLVIFTDSGAAISRHRLESLLEPLPKKTETLSILEEIRCERRQRFCSALRTSAGNITRAARTLGLPRTTFRRQLRRLGLLGVGQS